MAEKRDPWHLTREVSIATIAMIALNIGAMIWGASELFTITAALQTSDQRQWAEINRVKKQQVQASLTLGEIKANTERSAKQLEQITTFLLEYRERSK